MLYGILSVRKNVEKNALVVLMQNSAVVNVTTAVPTNQAANNFIIEDVLNDGREVLFLCRL